MLALRPFQKSALHALENRHHVLCIAPTGSGKSLIYERFAANPGRKTLLVTPLIALGRQQRRRLQEAGVLARLGTGPTPEPPPTGSGAWIVSPERLESPGARMRLRDWAPDFLIVDECHCLWDWGDTFRPAFAGIPSLLAALPSLKKSLWLTATLPREARQDLRAALPVTLAELGSFAIPPSLSINVLRVPWRDRAEALLSWLAAHPAPGIVFVNTREGAERVSRLVRSTQRNALFYHAGLSQEEKHLAEHRIGQAGSEVIVATSAFGMGMDHGHLQWCLLWQAPTTLLALAQALGRAGRAPGVRAEGALLWDSEDFQLLEWAIRSSERMRRQVEQVSQFVHAPGCRVSNLSRYFDGSDGRATDPGSCGEQCDFCKSRLTFPPS